MIRIVTDSSSDLPEDYCREQGIQVVPAVVILGDDSFLDGEGLSREEFYELLPGLPQPPTTAAPSAGSFEEVYEQLLTEGADQVISIHLASTLSGIYNAARIAGENFGARVQVVDSGQLTMGLGFQVMAAAREAKAGAGREAVLAQVESVRGRIRLTAMLDTLEYLRRSGRVSFMQAMLGSALRMRVFMEVEDGEVRATDRTRTRKKGIAHLGSLLKDLGPLTDLALLHTNAEEDAREFQERFAAQQQNVLLVNVTTVIGTHVGPKGLGFAAVLAG